MKIWQHINFQIKNIIPQISHYNTFHFFRYTQFRYVKCYFTTIQKQQNMSKSSLIRINNASLYEHMHIGKFSNLH